MKNLLTIPVEINHKVHLELILKLCNVGQIEMFLRMYPGGVSKMEPSSYKNAIDQVERTILRVNGDIVRLRDIEQESKQKDAELKRLVNRIAELESMHDMQTSCMVKRITELETTVDQRNETLKKFDNLTDVLTEGYGAASCINPLVDATNAIAKIRGILAESSTALQHFQRDEIQARLDKLDALESCGVDNWEGYDFAMEQIDA